MLVDTTERTSLGTGHSASCSIDVNSGNRRRMRCKASLPGGCENAEGAARSLSCASFLCLHSCAVIAFRPRISTSESLGAPQTASLSGTSAVRRSVPPRTQVVCSRATMAGVFANLCVAPARPCKQSFVYFANSSRLDGVLPTLVGMRHRIGLARARVQRSNVTRHNTKARPPAQR